MSDGHMIRARLAFVLAVLAGVACVRPTAASDSEFSDFRIPKHRWSTWAIDFSGGGRSSHNEVPDQTGSEGLLSGGLRSVSEWGFDSDRLQHRLALSAHLLGERRHVERTLNDTLGRRASDISSHNASETVALDGSTRLYPWRFPLGFDASGFGEATFGQSTVDVEDKVFTPFRSAFISRQEVDQNVASVGASLSLGLGRVRDATGVYRAWLLEQRLLDTGNLTRRLSRAAREKLAALFYVEKRFAIPHDRPEKFFWREVERILREDGALENGALDAFAVYRVIEPAFEARTPARSAGFFVGPSIFVREMQAVRSQSSRTEFTQIANDSVINRVAARLSQQDSFRDSFVGVGGQAEYHLPIDLRWQFDASSLVRYVDESKYLQLSSGAMVSYLIADRWYADGWANHSCARLGSGANQREAWSVGYGGSLSYYLEDAWRLGISWDGGNTHQDDRDASTQQFSLGVSYHIAGSLEVPGVVDPVRLMRQ